MATEKLYYVNQYEIEAACKVISCTEGKKGYEVILDKTVFYPTGGGQPCDFGSIDGAAVVDVTEREGEIIHLCKEPVAVGQEVACKIDWQRRFRFMQQHSGEHLISGLVHKRFGYENTGFHMGAETVTVDFSGEISPEALQEIELAANQAIYRNIQTKFYFPTEDELPTFHYRSKKELSGWVRLVEFAGIDLCACCALHVARTGEIGLIKILSSVKFREGTRLEMLCGAPALAYLTDIYRQNQEISALFSAKPLQTAKAALRISEELAQTKYRLVAIENQLFAAKAAAYENAGEVLLFEPAMEPDALRRLTDCILQKCGGRCGIFSGEDGNYKYAIGCLEGDLRDTARALNAALQGRGGGKPNFVQGSVACARSDIEAFFEALK